MTGLRVKGLKYYYSNVPNYNQAITTGSEWEELTYDAPLQDQYGEGGAGYIVKQGYDVNDRLIALPTLCGINNGGGSDKYFADAFYSKNETPTTEYVSHAGGGWDHAEMAGIYCLRCWHYDNTANQLLGNRPVYRG